MLVTVDKQDFVVSVKREASDAQTESAIREIHHAEQSLPTTQICKGPWHRKSGVGTVLPLSAFDYSERRHKLNSTCRECRVKSENSRNGRVPEFNPAKPEAIIVAEPPNPILIVGPVIVPQRWRITIIRKTEIEVLAADFLDAAAQAGEGEVLKVERLD